MRHKREVHEPFHATMTLPDGISTLVATLRTGAGAISLPFYNKCIIQFVGMPA